MEVVYLFSERASVRVPFFDYDRRLFRLLLAMGGGVWNNALQEFNFGRTDAETFRRKLSGIPWVWVENGSSVPARVFGFFESAWEGPANEAGAEETSLDAFSRAPNFPPRGPASQPERFSENWQIKLEAELRSRKYSPRTLRSYVYYNRFLCRLLQKTPEEILPEDITSFLADIERTRDYSASSMNLAISAVKFFYNNVFKNESIGEKYRPRHDQRLPVVLAKTEINRILGLETNPKHRLLLMLAYSSGLRVSEVVALKKEHIDMERKVINVRGGKGRKDRCTILSEKTAVFIAEYFNVYDITAWVFPGQAAANHLSIRSAQYIFDKAVRRAEIDKNISIHSLRHAFATHLLESGTDIRYIQTLLGHTSIRTTERYAHVARRNVLKIQSPLDSIL